MASSLDSTSTLSFLNLKNNSVECQKHTNMIKNSCHERTSVQKGFAVWKLLLWGAAGRQSVTAAVSHSWTYNAAHKCHQ